MPAPKSPPPDRSPMPIHSQLSLQQPSPKRSLQSKSTRLFRRFRSVFRSFPIMNPTCGMPISLHTNRLSNVCHIHGGIRLTGTLYGYRKSRINLVIQENSRCLPTMVLVLSISTDKLLHEMGSGLVRIALECEKRPSEKTKLVDEPIWSMYCNGRKTGYAVRREPTDEDLNVMKMLHAVSMGAGVLPPACTAETAEGGDLTYMRAYFERVVGSKDSETYYMMSPDHGNSGPELSLFFVRI